MTLKKIKCLRDLYQVIESKKNEVIPVEEIWTLFHKYDIYHKCKTHQDQQNLIEFSDRKRKDIKILFFILEKLYMAKSTDSHLVSAVIKRIHNEGIWFNTIIADLFGESKYFETKEIIQMLEYCLKFTYMKKMLFHGLRMANFDYFFPITLLPDNHYVSSLPTIMGILLRYGMLLDPVTGQGPTLGDIFDKDIYIYGRPNTRVALWYSIINEGVISSNPHFQPANELPSKKKKIFNLCLEIANLLIRDAVKIRRSVFKVSMSRLDTFLTHGSDWDYWSDDSDNVSEYNPPSITEDTGSMAFNNLKNYPTNELELIQKLGHFIPGLIKRCLEPTPLKHFCKQIIRKTLHLNWQLPNGVFNLNLPTKLVRYLNLEVD